MQHPRLAERLYNEPLLLLPEKAEVIERVFAAYQAGDEAKLPKWEPEREHAALLVPARRTEAGYSLTAHGVAIVPMMGSLVQRAGGLDAMSGLTGYNRVTAMLDAAMRDPLVRGVVLDVDSPGGEVAGAFELASFIANAPKPVYAVANELAASAAYLIASAATEIYLPSTAQVGSVGVVLLHQDRSEVIAKSGVRYTPIFAGAKKIDGSSLTPLSEGARLDLQARVDDVHEQFIAAVAERRGIKPKAVRDTEAGMLSASRAVAEGFADKVGTLTDAITALHAELARPGFTLKTRAASEDGSLIADGGGKDEDMSKTIEQPAAATATDLANERAAGYAQAEKDLTPKAKAEGATEERARIAAILAHDEAKERPAAARQVAMETDMPVATAAKFLAGLPKESPTKPANALAAAMPPNPSIGAGGEKPDKPAGKTINAQGIFAKRAEQAKAALAR
ncbi:MAG: S49 family peptidase [Burkholderiales bacterium]|nr:S49 family peptidase [Burkholderiales bacterium]